MRKKSSDNLQLNLFSSPSNTLIGKSLASYEDPIAWHNQFRDTITFKINEEIFFPLYDDSTGRPNASIRVLVAMMILKESAQISDQKLFESCRFNLLFRSALGLINMSDELPSESTYYLFRKKITAYEKDTSENLFDKVFVEITKKQCLEFNVSGERVRMDSKLISSNIAWFSRFELIHLVLSTYYKGLTNKAKLPIKLKAQLDELTKVEGKTIFYRNNLTHIKGLIKEMGPLIYQLLNTYPEKSSKHYLNLDRLFSEQYDVVSSSDILPKEKEKISAKSLQSPHDAECHYRNKGGKNGQKKQEVKGYAINITETCHEQDLNLITTVSVDVATKSDVNFFSPDLEKAQDVLPTKIEHVHTDGGYYSPDNMAFCELNDINLHLHAINGFKGRYDLSPTANGNITVIDTTTGEIIPNEIIITENQTKWKIKTGKGYRYFTQKEVTACVERKKIEAAPVEVLQKRNNVEATIFQLAYNCSGSKSKYRSLSKQKIWANARCLWVNFRRIMKFAISRLLNPSAIMIEKSYFMLFGAYIIAFLNHIQQKISCKPGRILKTNQIQQKWAF
jgi:hypothetical protein